LNLWPSSYEPDELPNCSTPQKKINKKMSLNSTLTQFSSILKNGQKANKLEVIVKKNSNTKNVLDILKKEGFIRDYITANDYTFCVYLKYFQDKPSIQELTVISKNNRYNITSLKQLRNDVKILRKQNQGLSTLILSTSEGLLTDYESISRNIGGQIILKIT
jgi:small subunit ribosomal protein S8|tara:strand:- start:2073 stop:2558 length:486 start_codon:yes stop_codon:yes gene_type:complete